MDKTDFLKNTKDKLKNRFASFYPFLIGAISPVLGRPFARGFLKQFDLEKEIVLNLGAGTTNIHPHVINVDLFNYKTVDLVAAISSLPLIDNSVDGVLTIATLEHVENPNHVVSEMYRILKPGKGCCCFIPFMQGIHGSPDDYQRYTPSGLKELFKDFSDLQVEVGAGPTSGFVWVLQEWLALLFSFGSRRLYWIFYFLFFCITPLKFVDILLAYHPMADRIASGFVIYGSKN